MRKQNLEKEPMRKKNLETKNQRESTKQNLEKKPMRKPTLETIPMRKDRYQSVIVRQNQEKIGYHPQLDVTKQKKRKPNCSTLSICSWTPSSVWGPAKHAQIVSTTSSINLRPVPATPPRARVANKKPTQKKQRKHLKNPNKNVFFFVFFRFFKLLIFNFFFETDFYEQIRHNLSFIYKK